MKKRILVVDDEQDLCEILRLNLEIEGYEVLTAHSAEEAGHIIGSDGEEGRPFDLLLLDVMMPGMSGFELAERLERRMPVIFLTARDAEEDVLRGFHLGADDYIAKPFSVRQLLARVRAVLGRTMPPTDNSEGLVLQADTKTALVDGKEAVLTRTEYALLQLLMAEPGHVFSRQELLEQVWPGDVIVNNRTVDVNITRLRKKLGRYAQNIANRQRFGYYFKAKD